MELAFCGGLSTNTSTRYGSASGKCITSKGSITSIQAVYVPADDLTDPSPATICTLDATVVLSRQVAELGVTLQLTLLTQIVVCGPSLLVMNFMLPTVATALQRYKNSKISLQF